MNDANYTAKTRRAIRKYTALGCIRAYYLNECEGEGASNIAFLRSIPNVNTTRAADAAINAGREIYNTK